MMVEELKEITDNVIRKNGDKFWNEFKDTLMEYLKKEAEKGNYLCCIAESNKVSTFNDINWIRSNIERNAVLEGLKREGLKVTYQSSLSASIDIDWEQVKK